jgi:hypothetical protein
MRRIRDNSRLPPLAPGGYRSGSIMLLFPSLAFPDSTTSSGHRTTAITLLLDATATQISWVHGASLSSGSLGERLHARLPKASQARGDPRISAAWIWSQAYSPSRQRPAGELASSFAARVRHACAAQTAR